MPLSHRFTATMARCRHVVPTTITSTSSLIPPKSRPPHPVSFSTTKRSENPGPSKSNFSQPYTGIYEPGGPTRGPLGQTSNNGAARITPRRLKQYLDKYVIGQERAKKMLSVAVYGHYLRVQEIKRQEYEEQGRIAREARKKSLMAQELYNSEETGVDEARLKKRLESLDAETDKVAAKETRLYTPIRENDFDSLADAPTVVLEKTNVMALGPTGVGKTHILKTLAKALDVPFSMSDCTSMTQAGYIGEDVEACVQRLLAAADWDVSRAEHGIICLDEVDKLAVTKSINGRDVGGEGVQQALLKLIEGKSVTISAKGDQRSSRNSNSRFGPNFDNSSQNGNKPEQYTVRTDNILFIFTGAFGGLQKIITERLPKGSIGFGASVRDKSANEMSMSRADAEVYFKNLPFYTPASSSSNSLQLEDEEMRYNPLDLVTPDDLRTFGLIPEFIGRIPVVTALSSLSVSELMRVLTEPRNSIISQYTLEFASSGAELLITTPALYEIAKSAHKLKTGARALRSVVENMLSEAKFEVPGSSARFVLVTAKAARMQAGVDFFSRGCRGEWRRAFDDEEMEWRGEQERRRRKSDGVSGSFEELGQGAASC